MYFTVYELYFNKVVKINITTVTFLSLHKYFACYLAWQVNISPQIIFIVKLAMISLRTETHKGTSLPGLPCIRVLHAIVSIIGPLLLVEPWGKSWQTGNIPTQAQQIIELDHFDKNLN